MQLYIYNSNLKHETNKQIIKVQKLWNNENYSNSGSFILPTAYFLMRVWPNQFQNCILWNSA